MSNRRSVNHYICGPDTAFPDFAAAVRDAGIEAVGLTRAALSEMGIAALRRCLADNGLAVSSLNSAGYFTAADGRPDESFALVDAAAELGAEALCVITGGAGDLPLADARARTADGFAALHERAAAAGVVLGLEPVHPADVLTKGVINSCAQALDFIAPFPAAKLILDLYHSWWDSDLAATARGGPERIALIQVCNIRLRDGWPVGRDTLAAGALDLSDYLPPLLSHGYAGTLELELFGRDLAGRSALGLVAAYPGELAAVTAGADGRSAAAAGSP